MNPPFEPTVCDCALDRKNCRSQPGHLLPGQLQTIAEFLRLSVKEVRRFFWASPGMVLEDTKTGQRIRVGTITPKLQHGKCVFYRQGQCNIHPVAPFGCRYFDAHMSAKEGQERAKWGRGFLLSRLEEYTREREKLEKATSWKPRPY